MNVLDDYMVDPRLSLLDKTRIQAQVLVPVLRALRAELGKERADAIVKDALVGIGKDGVGLSGLFEFFFGGGIVGITVRMKLQGQLAISALNFLIVSGAGDAQHFVKIAFSVGIQNLVSYRGCESMFGIACHANHGGP